MNYTARNAALQLETARKFRLGTDAAITLFAGDNREIGVIAAFFDIYRESNLALGEEYEVLRIAETDWFTDTVQLTRDDFNHVVKVLFRGTLYNASQVENWLDTTRVYTFRLNPLHARK